MPARRTFAVLSLALVTSLVATPAFAQDDYYEEGYDPAPLPPIPDAETAQAGPAQIVGYSDEARQDWLAECRTRVGHDNGVGGAIIGGVIGGVAGNRIAGRGNRTVGTVVGAGVGAVAGAAIDKAEDRGEARDFCEDYLDRYEASYRGPAAYGQGYAPAYVQPGVSPYGNAGAYGYPAGRVMWVPVVIKGGCKPKCCKTERVIEEVAPPAPARRVIQKRVPIAPTKYTKTVKTKYSK